MTPEEAQELRIYLTNQLIEHGFSTVADQANLRLLEKLEFDPKGLEIPKDPDPERQLIDFLTETIEVFRNNSNENYTEIIARINKNLEGEKIEGILVELPGESDEYDLASLPNYYEIYQSLGMIRENLLRDR